MSIQELGRMILYYSVSKLIKCKNMSAILHITEGYQDVIYATKRILINMNSSITVPSVNMTFAKLAPSSLIES